MTGLFVHNLLVLVSSAGRSISFMGFRERPQLRLELASRPARHKARALRSEGASRFFCGALAFLGGRFHDRMCALWLTCWMGRLR
jgi:hypothetical protein